MKISRRQRQDERTERMIAEWGKVLGPDYAPAAVRARQTVLKGLLISSLSTILMVVWLATFAYGFSALGAALISVAFIVPGNALLWVAVVRTNRLSSTIKRDIIAAGFPAPRSGPDLRGTGWIKNWSVRQKVPLENVIAAGRAAAAREDSSLVHREGN